MVEDYSPYKVMESSEYPPGNCFVTGSAQGPFIDTGVYIPKERFGQLVLSRDFIAQAARELGLFDGAEEREQRAYDIGYAEGVKEELSGHLDRAVDQLGLAVDVLRSIRDAGSSGVEEPLDASGAEDAGDPVEEPVVDSRASKTRRSGKAARQGAGDAGDERPAGVPAGAGHDDPFRV